MDQLAAASQGYPDHYFECLPHSSINRNRQDFMHMLLRELTIERRSDVRSYLLRWCERRLGHLGSRGQSAQRSRVIGGADNYAGFDTDSVSIDALGYHRFPIAMFMPIIVSDLAFRGFAFDSLAWLKIIGLQQDEFTATAETLLYAYTSSSHLLSYGAAASFQSH